MIAFCASRRPGNAGRARPPQHTSDRPIARTTVAKYSYQQLKWGLVTKPALRDRFVLDTIDSELQGVYEDIDALFDEVADGRVLMFPASASSL